MIRVARAVTLAAVFVAAPSPTSAQQIATRVPRRPSAAAVDRAVATITEADFGAKLGALAHDSTRGRETPSPELARAADWIATRFRAAGLQPVGDGGSFLQHFRLRHTQLDTLTTITIAAPGHTVRWTFGREFVPGGGQPSALRDLPVVLMAGAPTDSARPFGDVSVRDAVILLVLPLDQLRGPVINPLASRAFAESAAAMVFVAPIPPPQWAMMQRAPLSRWTLADVTETAASRSPAAFFALQESATDLLRAAGEDPAAVLAPERRGVRTLPGVTFSLAVHQTTVEEPTVANVVGVLQGSDRSLRDEAVVFTAHYDHVGVVGWSCHPSPALPADSICNGADNNASGTVGAIEIAEAFAALNPRPARTLVFAALAANERGLLGARHYLERPVVPIERTAAVINLDMIARNPRDTVGLVGKDYSTLGAVVDRTAREHPELRLTPRDIEGTYYPDSDHYAFAQRGVPALFFFSGIHHDLHTAADNVDRADVEQATRIARLAFRVGLEVASAADRPVWDPLARAQVGSH